MCAVINYACCSADIARLRMTAEAPSSSTSKTGLLVFAGGILIGGTVAAGLAYAYSNAYQDDRRRNRQKKGTQR